MIYNLLNSRENRGLQAELQRSQQEFQAGESAQSRDLQKILAELGEKGDTYRASLSAGSNQYPQTTQIPTYGIDPEVLAGYTGTGWNNQDDYWKNPYGNH